MFNILNQNVLVNGKVNGAAIMVRQRQESIDNTIEQLVKLYNQKIDINNDDIHDTVLENNNLSDATVDELEYIAKEVRKRC